MISLLRFEILHIFLNIKIPLYYFTILINLFLFLVKSDAINLSYPCKYENSKAGFD